MVSWPNPPGVPLELGARGSDVLALQRALNDAGAAPRVTEDGAFGPSTRAAVEYAQRAAGLPVTGIADGELLAAIARAAPPVGSGLGARALAIALGELAAGVREDPGRPNRGTALDRYADGCVRRGRRLGSRGIAWCAAFASWCLWTAAFAGDPAMDAFTLAFGGAQLPPTCPPIGYRAAVHELVTDARATGVWHDLRDGFDGIESGDLLIMGRNGQDPRLGNEGHVGFVVEVLEDGSFMVVSGNDGDAVRLGPRTLADREEPIVGWIACR